MVFFRLFQQFEAKKVLFMLHLTLTLNVDRESCRSIAIRIPILQMLCVNPVSLPFTLSLPFHRRTTASPASFKSVARFISFFYFMCFSTSTPNSSPPPLSFPSFSSSFLPSLTIRLSFFWIRTPWQTIQPNQLSAPESIFRFILFRLFHPIFLSIQKLNSDRFPLCFLHSMHTRTLTLPHFRICCR